MLTVCILQLLSNFQLKYASVGKSMFDQSGISALTSRLFFLVFDLRTTRRNQYSLYSYSLLTNFTQFQAFKWIIFYVFHCVNTSSRPRYEQHKQRLHVQVPVYRKHAIAWRFSSLNPSIKLQSWSFTLVALRVLQWISQFTDDAVLHNHAAKQTDHHWLADWMTGWLAACSCWCPLSSPRHT